MNFVYKCAFRFFLCTKAMTGIPDKAADLTASAVDGWYNPSYNLYSSHLRGRQPTAHNPRFALWGQCPTSDHIHVARRREPKDYGQIDAIPLNQLKTQDVLRVQQQFAVFLLHQGLLLLFGFYL